MFLKIFVRKYIFLKIFFERNKHNQYRIQKWLSMIHKAIFIR